MNLHGGQLDAKAAMGASPRPSDKFLAYDGDCPMCTAAVELLWRYHLVEPSQTRSNNELQGAQLQMVRDAGIRNQLVVLEPSSGQTRIGSDGLLWIVRDNPRYRLLARLLGLPIFRHAMRYGYETISYNRRILSPPRHQIVCDCEPEATFARRVMLVVPALLAAMVSLIAFGAALTTALNLAPVATGVTVLALAGVVGLVALCVATRLLLTPGKRIDYLAHFSVALVASTWLLLPAALLALFVPPSVALVLGGGSFAVASLSCVRMLRRRTATLTLYGWKAWAGAAAWVIGALAAAVLCAVCR